MMMDVSQLSDRSKITKQTLLKNAVGKAIYEINARRFSFKIVCYDGGVPYGYCSSKRLWAHLHPTYVATDKGEFIAAEQIFIE